jgi:DNA-binding MarR family transcriptional regulator
MSTVSDVSPDDWAIWRLYISSGRHLVAELDRRLQADAGVSHPEHTVLLSLNEAPRRQLRTGELAELLAWEKSRVSHQVARMEARGLVERTACETDGRGTWIGITAEGRRLLLRAMRAHAADIRELFVDRLTDDEKASIRAASIRMLEAIDPAAITAALGREDAVVTG